MKTKIELKNVKYSDFASEETHCFQATVYVNGKRAFIASNDGHGGPDRYDTLNNQMKQSEVDSLVRALNEELGKETHTCSFNDPNTGKPAVIGGSLEITIGHLMNEHLRVKDVKKDLRRITYYDGKKGTIMQLAAKYKPTPSTLELVPKAQWWRKDMIILNGLPMDKILSYYDKAGV